MIYSSAPFAVISLLSLISPTSSEGVSRPNVLMIIVDDLNDWVGCLGGHPDARTPNIDRLAQRGLLFTNAHCAAPVCNPSRVAALTGRRPSSTGVYDNAPVWHERMPGLASIPQHFKANGYYTAGGGKVYHHPPGFNRRGDWDEYFDQVFNGHYQRILQAYLASITFCDAMVGRLLDALDASPAAENTIVVFWSDNGWHFGEKEHLHKMTLWARSTRLPLIFAAPGVTSKGSCTSRPVSLVDLFPTLNELCNLPQLDSLEGTSLVPLLKNPNRTWDRPALVTYLPGNHALCNERWRYIRYADGGEELYDHQNDPHEWNNLADRTEMAVVKARLARWLPTTDAPNLRDKAKKLRLRASLYPN